MLASFTIETVLALYTVVRYKLDVLGKLVLVSLLALAIFQLCEYHVCGGWGVRASEWSRGGFAAITLLPPLGLHILHVLANKPKRKLIAFAYVTMLGFVAYFTVVPNVFAGYACTGNYVIFQIGLRPAIVYGLYYYGWLVTAIVLGVAWAQQIKRQASEHKPRLIAVQALIIGYLIFLVPTALANSVKPSTRQGIPSIMCGFAVLFAGILAFFIMPRLGKRRRPSHS